MRSRSASQPGGRPPRRDPARRRQPAPGDGLARRAGWAPWLLLVLIAGAGAGCAYFNTFYHAQKAFKRAEKVQRESKSDKLSPEALNNYDKAIEKAAKVIFEHGGGWNAGIDDALFLQGQCYYGKKEYDTAIKKFNEIVINFPESNHATEALFYTGLCYHRMRNYATAKRIFDRVLRMHPDFHRRDEIVLTSAEGLDAEGNYQGALERYRYLVDNFGDSDKRVDALQRIGDIHYEAARYDSALAGYEELARIARDDDVYFEAQLNAGACLVRLGEPEEAMSIYQRIMPEEPRNENAGRVALAMAEAENRRGGHDEAIEHLQRVSEDFSNRNLGIEADFRLGYTYEVYQQDYALAREAYEAASRASSQSVFKEQAARRLRNIQHLEELQAETDEEETAERRRADAALKVAEFAYFESSDPEDAFEKYGLVVEQFPGSEAALRAAYARAWIMRSDFDSASVARELFAGVVDRYPASPQAEYALSYLEELDYPADRLAVLDRLARSARDRQRYVDDSLAAVQAVADSIAAVEAAAAAAAAAAQADSLDRVRRVGARSRVAFEAADQVAQAYATVDSLAAAAAARIDSLGTLIHGPRDSATAAVGASPEEASPPPVTSVEEVSPLVLEPTRADSAATGDSAAVAHEPPAPEPAVVDTAAVERLLTATRARSEADLTAARRRADSLQVWAEGVIDSVARAQAVAESLAAVQAQARADSIAAAAARADSLAEILAAERLAERRALAEEDVESSDPQSTPSDSAWVATQAPDSASIATQAPDSASVATQAPDSASVAPSDSAASAAQPPGEEPSSRTPSNPQTESP